MREMYKRQICWSNSFTLSANTSAPLLPLGLIATMNIELFLVFTAISLGLTKRNKPVFPTCIPATSLDTADTACPSNSLIDEEVRKTGTMLSTNCCPCDCGGPGWEKIDFYDFSQQECPPSFTCQYGGYNNTSCQPNNKYYGVIMGHPIFLHLYHYQ